MMSYFKTDYPDARHTKVIAVPIFENNYVYVLTDDSLKCLIVDPGLPEPVCQIIKTLGLQPTHLLITHSHPDHIGGVDRVMDIFPDIQKIDFSNCPAETNIFDLNGRPFQVFKTPGHLPDHICFFETVQKILFCGDILFRFGCGRIFSGTFNELFRSLQTLKILPPDTDVFCTHEYTEQNLAFCIENNLVDPSQFTALEKSLINSIPSLPVRLSVELKYNPFLKSATLGDFSMLRTRRNEYHSKPQNN